MIYLIIFVILCPLTTNLRSAFRWLSLAIAFHLPQQWLDTNENWQTVAACFTRTARSWNSPYLSHRPCTSFPMAGIPGRVRIKTQNPKMRRSSPWSNNSCHIIAAPKHGRKKRTRRTRRISLFSATKQIQNFCDSNQSFRSSSTPSEPDVERIIIFCFVCFFFGLPKYDDNFFRTIDGLYLGQPSKCHREHEIKTKTLHQYFRLMLQNATIGPIKT